MSAFADEVAQLRGTRSATLKDLLRHPPFARLLAAMTVSSLGDWVGFTAVVVLVTSRYQHSLSAAAAAGGAVLVARTLPALLFGPFAGALVDGTDRRRTMILADLGRGVMYCTMPFLGPVWAIYGLSFLIECLSLLWIPSRDASLPQLVPRRQLPNANSLGLFTTYATLPVGGAIATVLAVISKALGAQIPYLGTHTYALALWLDAATFGFSALMLTRVPIRTPKSRVEVRFDFKKVLDDMRDGLRFLLSNPLTRELFPGVFAAFIATGAVLSIGGAFAQNTLKAGNTGWGTLLTAFGVGMGFGIVALNSFGRGLDREFVFSSSMLAASSSLLALALMPNLASAAFVTSILGVFCGTMWVTGYTLLQENVTDEYRGRTFGSLTVVSRLGLFFPLLIFPAIASAVGKHTVNVGHQPINLDGTRIALMVASGLVITAAASTRRRLKRLRLTRPKPLALIPKLKRATGSGFFIAFEGVEGAGKGTQIAMAQAGLEAMGRRVLVTREPGGTDLGEHLRELLLDPKTGMVEARTEALLFAAARTQLVQSVIRPALDQGKVVLCDRYIDSSLAYQGSARGLGEQDVLTLNVWATQGLFPDLVILLHLEPEIGLNRSADTRDRMELEGGDFHAKVADAYLRIAEEHPERFVVIEADREPAVVHDAVMAAISKLLSTPHADVVPPSGGPSG